MISAETASCVAFIFARGGSKGLPRKNIRSLNGIPLIAHSILVALESSMIHRVLVSTDDQEIAEIALKYGAEVPFMRPYELADDQSSEYDAWKHAITEYVKAHGENFSLFISLPPTSPLRSVSDVDDCIREYMRTDADMVVTVKTASRSPYFNMLKNDENGYSTLVNLASDGSRYVRRQDVPVVFDMTTVAYVSSPNFILQSDSLFSGKIRSVLIPEERAIDIDTLLDFRFAEFLITQKEAL